MPNPVETLAELFTTSVPTYAENPFYGVRVSDTQWDWTTYAEFGDLVDKARGGLAQLGVGRGDRVAIISDNRPEWAVGAYAAYTLGAAWVPMYEAQTQKDWSYILKDSGAKVLLAATDGIRAQVEEIKANLPDLHKIVVIDDPAGGEAINFDELIAQGTEHPAPVAVVEGEDLAGLIYTSGTTGNPKGVMLSHHNLASNVEAIGQTIPVDQDDRSASFLPWAHSFGQTCELHYLFSKGGSMGLTSAANLTTDMPDIKPTMLVSVPTVFNKVYDGLQKRMEAEGGITQTMFNAAVANAHKQEELRRRGKRSRWVDLQADLFDRIVFSKVRAAFGGRLKWAFSGGAAISTEVAEFISAVGITVFEGYGLTETSPVTNANRPGHRKIGSVGQAIPGVRIEIDHDITGDPQVGEIIVHGPNVMKGYYNLPAENEAVFTADGGFRTGDLGHVDDEGYLYIRGRIKEQYKLENGKYVVPSPIEEQLQLSGFINQVMVYGEQRPFNVAVVVPDFDYLQKWAAEKGLDTSDLTTLLSDADVKELYKTEIQRAQAGIKHYERIRDFVLEDEEFTPENGMLTPSLKIKRRAIMEKLGAEIANLYETDDPLLGRDKTE